MLKYAIHNRYNPHASMGCIVGGTQKKASRSDIVMYKQDYHFSIPRHHGPEH